MHQLIAIEGSPWTERRVKVIRGEHRHRRGMVLEDYGDLLAVREWFGCSLFYVSKSDVKTID